MSFCLFLSLSCHQCTLSVGVVNSFHSLRPTVRHVSTGQAVSLCACTAQPIKSLSSCECLLHFTSFISSQTTFPPSWHSSLERTTHVHPLMSQTGAFFMDVQVCVRSAYRYDVVNCPSCVCVCVHVCVCVLCTFCAAWVPAFSHRNVAICLVSPTVDAPAVCLW